MWQSSMVCARPEPASSGGGRVGPAGLVRWGGREEKQELGLSERVPLLLPGMVPSLLSSLEKVGLQA